METFSFDRSPSVTCRWSAAKQDFLKALQLDAASGAKDNAALLNNLGMVRTHKTSVTYTSCDICLAAAYPGFKQAS
jgi:hypothetical protein